DERQHVDVLPQRRQTFGDRNERRQVGVEAQRVGDDEGRDSDQGVREDVERDEQAVVPPQHPTSPPAERIRGSISSPKRARLKRSACARIRCASNRRLTALPIALANASAVSSPTSTPVSPSTTVSVAPPRPRATTGQPHACASSGTIPKSSS